MIMPYREVFPTQVGMNRGTQGRDAVIPRIPHASGDEPNARETEEKAAQRIPHASGDEPLSDN